MPLHFTAFHPDYKMRDLPHTPPETLRRARAIAKRAGLKHVYTGNVHDREGDTTACASCGAELIVRDWYRIERYALTDEGACPKCGAALAGRFSTRAGDFGRRRIPIAIGV